MARGYTDSEERQMEKVFSLVGFTQEEKTRFRLFYINHPDREKTNGDPDKEHSTMGMLAFQKKDDWRKGG